MRNDAYDIVWDDHSAWDDRDGPQPPPTAAAMRWFGFNPIESVASAIGARGFLGAALPRLSNPQEHDAVLGPHLLCQSTTLLGVSPEFLRVLHCENPQNSFDPNSFDPIT